MVLHVSRAVEQLLKKARWIDQCPPQKTQIYCGLRCGDSQDCFHLPSFAAIEEIECEVTRRHSINLNGY